MIRKIHYIIALLASLALPLMSKAQCINSDSINPCHIKVSCSTYGIAQAISHDSYLSDEYYGGGSLYYGHENFRYARTGTYMWKYRTGFNGILGTTTLCDSYQHILMLNRTWSGYHTFRMSDICHLLAGPIIELTGGAIYMPSNSNNPVSAKLRTSLGASGMLICRARDGDGAIRLQLDASLVGAAFSPEYGESYYEIFGLGNYDNTIKLTHPGNAFSWRATIAVDMPLGKKKRNTLRISYILENYQSELNGLHNDISYSLLSFGFVKTLYKIKGKNPLNTYNPYSY